MAYTYPDKRLLDYTLEELEVALDVGPVWLKEGLHHTLNEQDEYVPEESSYDYRHLAILRRPAPAVYVLEERVPERPWPVGVVGKTLLEVLLRKAFYSSPSMVAYLGQMTEEELAAWRANYFGSERRDGEEKSI